MAEPTVDVCEWIREASAAIDRAYGVQAQLPREAPAVLSAMAELIEAAKLLNCAAPSPFDADIEYQNALDRFATALARVSQP